MERPRTPTHTTGRDLAIRLFALVSGNDASAADRVHVPLGEDGGHFEADLTTIGKPDAAAEAISDAVVVGGTYITPAGEQIAGHLTFGAGNPVDALTPAHVTLIEN